MAGLSCQKEVCCLYFFIHWFISVFFSEIFFSYFLITIYTLVSFFIIYITQVNQKWDKAKNNGVSENLHSRLCECPCVFLSCMCGLLLAWRWEERDKERGSFLVQFQPDFFWFIVQRPVNLREELFHHQFDRNRRRRRVKERKDRAG